MEPPAPVCRLGHVEPGSHFLDEFGRNLADEAGGLPEAVLTVQPALLGVAQVELAHRPGGAHVAQAPLLLEAFCIVQRPAMRETGRPRAR